MVTAVFMSAHSDMGYCVLQDRQLHILAEEHEMPFTPLDAWSTKPNGAKVLDYMMGSTCPDQAIQLDSAGIYTRASLR